VELANPIPLPLADVFPPQARFAHESRYHGPAHVARVMIHAFLLLELTDSADLAAPLWGSVYLHDLARTHDGVCQRHGADAARLLASDPDLAAHLARGGVTKADHEGVAAAVTLHSVRQEPAPDHPHVRLTRLLKDADGLDRVRLFDLDPRYLRHDAARKLVPFAQILHDGTWPQEPEAFFAEAGRLWDEFRLNRC